MSSALVLHLPGEDGCAKRTQRRHDQNADADPDNRSDRQTCRCKRNVSSYASESLGVLKSSQPMWSSVQPERVPAVWSDRSAGHCVGY